MAARVLAFLGISFGQYALGLWLPPIVRGFSGLDNLQVGIVSAIPNRVAVVVMVAVGANSDRTRANIAHRGAPMAGGWFIGWALARSPAASVIALSFAAAGLVSSHGSRRAF